MPTLVDQQLETSMIPNCRGKASFRTGVGGHVLARNDALFCRFGGRKRVNIAAILREWRAVSGGALVRSGTISDDLRRTKKRFFVKCGQRTDATRLGRERGGALGMVGGHWQDGQTVFIGRKVSSCGRAAGASVACKDQCNAFPGLLQDFRGNWGVKGGPAGAFGTNWDCWGVRMFLDCFLNRTRRFSSPALSD